MKQLIIGLALLTAISMPAMAQSVGDTEKGLAAVYSNKLHGHVTASGQVYDKGKLTAAHKTLPFGTKLKVTNERTHKSVTLRINDRGPVQAGRILDISPAAAAKLGMKRNTMREVSYEVVTVGNGKRVAHHGHRKTHRH